jgi:hypothetical protein
MRFPFLGRPSRMSAASCIALALLGSAAAPAWAGDGLLGLFFDRNASECSGNLGSGQSRTVHVVLATSGATAAGAAGIEFRIDAASAGGYVLHSAQVPSNVVPLGDALGSGLTAAYPSCQYGNILWLSLQIQNPGSGRSDVEIGLTHRVSDTPYECPTAILCDDPYYTAVCVETGKLLVNPSTARPCGPTRAGAEWSRVKELYRD